MAIADVGVDLAKNVVILHAVDQRGAVVFRCARKRREWVDAARERVNPSAVIAMEACVFPSLGLLQSLKATQQQRGLVAQTVRRQLL